MRASESTRLVPRPRPADGACSALFDGRSVANWRVEHDPTSLGAVDVAPSVPSSRRPPRAPSRAASALWPGGRTRPRVSTPRSSSRLPQGVVSERSPRVHRAGRAADADFRPAPDRAAGAGSGRSTWTRSIRSAPSTSTISRRSAAPTPTSRRRPRSAASCSSSTRRTRSPARRAACGSRIATTPALGGRHADAPRCGP